MYQCCYQSNKNKFVSTKIENLKEDKLWDVDKNCKWKGFKIVLVENAIKWFYYDYEKNDQVVLSKSIISTWLMKHVFIDMW